MKAILEQKFARVVAVVAHPDDEAVFCGGTLRRLVAENTCQVAVVCTTDVAQVNGPREPSLVNASHDEARRRRRLVAFGMSLGMIGADRFWLFDLDNNRADDARARAVEDRLVDLLVPVLRELGPACVLTHGLQGDYGHAQHRVVARATARAWSGDLWHFAEAAAAEVQVDINFKYRLLDCYRRGTTQGAFWSPRANPGRLAAWLGPVERFRLRADPR